MNFKTGMTALAIAGSLVAGPALAQVDYRESPYEYQGVELFEPISSNLPGQNLAGLDIVAEDIREERLAAERERLEAERQARLERQQAEQQARAEREREAESRAARLERERELERQQRLAEQQRMQERASRQQQAQQQAQGATRIEWGYYEPTQANTAVVPPPLAPQFISELQRHLQERGLNPGPIDGDWGLQTYQALEQYQEQQQGLAGNGQLTPQTVAALNLERATAGQRASADQQQGSPQG